MTANELLMRLTAFEDQVLALRRDAELIRPVNPELAAQVFAATEQVFALMADLLASARKEIEERRGKE